MSPIANWYTESLQSSQVPGVVAAGRSAVELSTSLNNSFPGSCCEHGLELTDTLKIQFEPIKIHIKMKNAKQSHMRRDRSVDSLSVFMDARIVEV